MSASLKEASPKLELRGRPAPVTRLSRRALAVVVGGLMLFALLAMLWAFRTPDKRAAPMEAPPEVERVTPAEGLQALPSDYRQVPAPVPAEVKPLPAKAAAGEKAEEPDPAADAEQQRLRSEADAAAKAELIFRTARDAVTDRETLSSVTDPSPTEVKTSAGEPDVPPVAKPGDRTHVDTETRSSSSPYRLLAGTVISAALLTAIHSDLPGPVIATVTEPIYDTLTGRYLLVPQGSRLIGEYDSQIGYGQSRVLLVWTRLICPDGSSVALDKLPAADATGKAGLEDHVDWHWSRLFARAALSTLLGVGAELAASDRYDTEGRIVIATRESVQENASQIGQQFTRRNLDLQPTLTIRAGMPVRAIVNRDLSLPMHTTDR